MKLKLIAAAVTAGLLCAAPTFAATLDFQGAGDYTLIQQYYNGGTNADGATGPNYGVSFGPDALTFVNDPTSPNYSNNPNPGILAAVGSDASLNVATGFTGDVSFWYSSVVDTAVNVYSGLNGTGSVLATFTLLANASNSCSDTPLCHWDFTSLNLGSVAQSIQFGSTYVDGSSVAGFDNVTVNAVPLPAAAWLMLSAIGGLGALRRKQTV